MALGVGTALVVAGCATVALQPGAELVSVTLVLLGHGAVLSCSLGNLAADRKRRTCRARQVGLLAAWTAMTAWSLASVAMGRLEDLHVAVLAAVTIALGALAVAVAAAPTASAQGEDPPPSRLAYHGLVVVGLLSPVVVGNVFRELMELGRLSPASAVRELGLGIAAQFLALILALGLVLARARSDPRRLAAAALVVVAASVVFSPALFGVRAGPSLLALQMLANLAGGWGVLLVPLMLSWTLGGLSVRSCCALAGMVLFGVGLLRTASPSLADAAMDATQAPRATVVFLALLSSLLAGVCGLGLWASARRAPTRRSGLSESSSR
jgi:hypothetical protein